jgi:diguanylate cyclase (GGDEF)-like protein/PAS domain S-box-containing protein
MTATDAATQTLAAAAMDAAMTGLVVFDEALRVHVWNAWMEKHSGLAAADVTGRTLDQALPELNAYLRMALTQTTAMRRSFMLSSLLHPRLFPLYTRQPNGSAAAPMRQQVFLLPLEIDGTCYGMAQIVDITGATRREQALQEAGDRLRTLIDAMPDLVVFKDDAGCWIEANEAAQRIFQLTVRDYRNQTDAQLIAAHPAQAAALAACAASDDEAWKQCAGLRDDVALPDKAVFDLIKVPIFRKNGSRRGLVVLGRDVSARKQAERDLALATQVFAHSNEAIVVTDAANRIISVNPAFTQTTGYGAREVIGQNPSVLQSGLHDAGFYEGMWQTLLAQNCWTGEILDRRKDGSIYPKWLSVRVVRGADGGIENFIALFSDISERKAIEQRMRYLAEHDFLTGLPNRVLLVDRVSQAIALARRQQRQLGVLFLDLDRFKAINDTLGHNVGDELLRAITGRLLAAVRGSDTVSRLGGDEFVLLLQELDDDRDLPRIAEHLLQVLQEPVRVGVHELHVSASIGIAVYPEHGEDIDTLMKNADTAMYQAKAAGRNGYVLFSVDMDETTRLRHQIEQALRHALADREFELHYQPQGDIESGDVVALEALVRWQRPGHGLVPPDRFIGIAEESGLIVPLTEWIIDEVCRQIRVWRDGGLPALPVAINLSPVQFRREGLFDMTMDKIRAYGLTTADIQFEITENVLMLNAESVLRTLEELRAAGIHLIIDDFGTGYSSLSYLKRFPIVKLKIDKSFVRDVTIDADDAAITSAIIGMATSLKLGVVAEGVENAAQLEFLRRHHCQTMQGYLLSRPLPPAQIEQVLRDGLRLTTPGEPSAGQA